MTLLIWTRSRKDWDRDRCAVESCGHTVLHLPCLKLRDMSSQCPDDVDRFVIVTSSNSVFFIKQNPSWRQGIVRFKGILTFGKETARSLDGLHSHIQCLPVGTGQQFSQKICQDYARRTRFLFVGAKYPAYDIVDHLKRSSFQIEKVSLYETIIGVDLSVEEKKRFTDRYRNRGVICFASPSAVSGFLGLMKSGGSHQKSQLHAVAIGPTTKALADAHFVTVDQAPEPKVSSLIRTAKRILDDGMRAR